MMVRPVIAQVYAVAAVTTPMLERISNAELKLLTETDL